jgi:hypothetical protein
MKLAIATLLVASASAFAPSATVSVSEFTLDYLGHDDGIDGF